MADAESIVVGGGCFWCIEAAFQQVRGVTEVTSGYAGGSVPNPDYWAVASGKTGHAEVVQVEFDSGVITLAEILDIFWAIHDPTTLNRQGPDVGTDYRSIILFTNAEQKPVIAESIENASKLWRDPVVTEVAELHQFYPAESEHQDFYKRDPSRMYCQIMINPKLAKLKRKFADKLIE